MGKKIGEIAKKSGVAASTIRYYVRQGLLPEPHKVNKSMAYYDESCVDKIHVIRYLQERRYFPLSVIKNILRRMDEGLSLEDAEAIEDVVFGTRTYVKNELVDEKTFLKHTGLTQKEMDKAESLGLLMPFIQEGDKKLFNQEDIRFGREVLKRLLSIGGNLEDMEFYVRLGKEITDNELKVRKKLVHGKPKKENIRVTAEISKIVDFLRSYILKRLFQRKVQQTIQKSLETRATK